MDTKALRQKVLDLAIRGKLVPQDPNDEPASVLLERIRAEKQRLVKDGKLKAKDIKGDTIIFVGDDNLHYEKFADGSVKCIEDEIPFELPEGWSWTRLLSIIEEKPANGYSPKGVDYITNVKNLTLTATTSGYFKPYEFKYVDVIIAPDSKYWLRHNDILIQRSNSRELVGTSCIYDCEDGAFIYPDLMMRIHLMSNVDVRYIDCVLKSALTRKYYMANAIGSAGSMPKINQAIVSNTLIPLPPCAEQKRLVQHLDEMVRITNTIEAEKTDILELISKAKTKILDLAIRGQLVQQNPSDEPASVLLGRIREEKEELIRQGKIKRDKKESIIFRGDDNSYYVRQENHVEEIDEQYVFDLPNGWAWCSLFNIAKIELGKTLDSAKNTGRTYPYLRSVNVRWNEIDLSDLKEMRFEQDEIERYTVRRNDLLICEGGDVGRSCVWTDDTSILYQNALHRVRFYGDCNPFYFMYHMMYYESRGIIKALCKGVTIKHLTGNVLSLIPFALPPLEEQNRIVAKLNKTFLLLDSIL